MAENHVPNLDSMDHSELMPFWNRHKRGQSYKELFPAGGEGTKRAAADLANYAINLHAAQFTRKRGDIATATQYERICQRIYDGLPDFAKW